MEKIGIIFSDDPNTPLNMKIKEAIGAGYKCDEEGVTETCREIYEMGHADGQQFVWDMRSGNFSMQMGCPPILQPEE